MDILAALECCDHILIIGQVGQHPQLDLRIVGVDQLPTGPRCEKAPHPAALLGAYGDIL